MYKSITMSSGHGKYVAGANCFLDEVVEARRVVNRVASYIKKIGASVNVIHDDVSKTKADNITKGKSSYLISKHDATRRELDVSIHFNASKKTNEPKGVEVYYYDDRALAAKVSKAIANVAGFRDRSAKDGKHLVFCKSTAKKAILIEICFVDSKADAELYNKNFDKICRAIAEVLTGKVVPKSTTPISPAPTGQIGIVEIIDPKLALRKGPNAQSEFIRWLKKGDKYKVYKKDPKTGWLNLGGSQWCSGGSAYVRFTKV